MIRKMTILIIRGTCHHMPFMRAIACGHLAKARAQPFAAPHDGSTASTAMYWPTQPPARPHTPSSLLLCAT